MNILVTVASRHGSTFEIAEAIAEELGASGHTSDLLNTIEVDTLDPYDAVIVGSAVYMGNWLPEATHFVERNDARLASLPVWYFSSGPLGQDDPRPHGDPPHIPELLQATGARGHRVFVGKLDKNVLDLSERLIATLVRAPAGDFRDWTAIRAWGKEIAMALQPELVTV